MCVGPYTFILECEMLLSFIKLSQAKSTHITPPNNKIRLISIYLVYRTIKHGELRC